MGLLWLGNFILIFVVVPIVVTILFQVLTPIFQIRTYAEDINEYGSLFPVHLESAQELVKTRDLVKQAGAGIEQYVRAIDKL